MKTHILDLRRFPEGTAQRTVRSTMFQIHAFELGAIQLGALPYVPFPASVRTTDAPYVYVTQDNEKMWWTIGFIFDDEDIAFEEGDEVVTLPSFLEKMYL